MEHAGSDIQEGVHIILNLVSPAYIAPEQLPFIFLPVFIHVNNFSFAFKKSMELELSTTTGSGVFTISKEFLVIVGLINSKNIPKMDKKRKKAKNKPTFDLFLALYRY